MKSKQVTIKVSPAFFKELKKQANDESRTVSGYAQAIFKKYLKAQKGNK